MQWTNVAKTTTSADGHGDTPTVQEAAAAAALHARFMELLQNTVTTIPAVQRRMVRLFVDMAVQHFQGYLLGHQHLAQIVIATSRCAQWAGVPPALGSAFVGMVAEAAVASTPRETTKRKTAEHVIYSGGALVETLMFAENGDELKSQGDAVKDAASLLVAMGVVSPQFKSDNLRAWHKRYREREDLPEIQRGAKSKPSA